MARIHTEHISSPESRRKLEIVLKCDSAGSVEAVTSGILHAAVPAVDIIITHSGIGDVTKSDILMAETGSRLIIGFQVGVLSGIDRELKARRVEVRLYDVIYKLIDDIKNIAEAIVPSDAVEEIIGSARVIALFKSSRKGIIAGCEVLSGYLAAGHRFRVISVMGPVYSGVIESMHIGENAVQKASSGQKAGIKIKDFKMVKVGDLVETFRLQSHKRIPSRQPEGRVIRR